MSTHKYIDQICVAVMIVALLATILFMNGESLGLQAVRKSMGYEDKLFDTSEVHTIDLEVEDWDEFLEDCENEEYVLCNATIDGESFQNIALRAKGNTSLRMVSQQNSDRYSFKLEFDHYSNANTYHGLDKLCLNNIIQDNTFLKDYLSYRMMAEYGVDAPLCSFTYITVNGEDWGLYLAVEGVEESFLQRNYGTDFGDLYKPDSMSMGGGRGNGKEFDMDAFREKYDSSEDSDSKDSDSKESDSKASDSKESDSKASDSKESDSKASDSKDREKKSSQNEERESFQQPGPFGGGPAMPDFDFSKVDWDKLDPTDFGLPEDFDLSSVDWDAIDMQALMSGSFDPTEVGLPEDFSFQNIDPSTLSSLFEEMGSAAGSSFPGGGRKAGPGGSSSDVLLQYTDDDPDSYSNVFNSAKTPVSDEDRQRLIASLKQLGEFEDLDEVLDTDEVMRYLVVHNFTVNGDSYTGAMIHNYYLYEEYGKLHMIPWDYNLAYGGFQGNDATSAVNDDIDAPLSVTGDGSRPMADWVYQTEEDKAKYHEYFAEFLEQVDILGILDEAYELIQPYVEKDPTKFCTTEEFETAVKTLREFCELRIESVQNQLSGDDTEVDASSIDLSDMGSMGMGGGMPGSGSDTSQGFPGTPPAEWPGGEMPQSPVKSERKTKSTTSASAKTAA